MGAAAQAAGAAFCRALTLHDRQGFWSKAAMQRKRSSGWADTVDGKPADWSHSQRPTPLPSVRVLVRPDAVVQPREAQVVRARPGFVLLFSLGGDAQVGAC